ncbi:MAG TPA: glycosyltransferase [Pirellulales bacterium]|jgi:glycosyltransferase involved in cell wall biosynthesis
MNPATVSVVIATYNYGAYIGEAIQSVLEQSYTGFELHIIDDGSTDDTQQIVSEFLSDARVRYHRTTNRGQSAAKNLGIALSTAPFVAFLDGDDLWLPDKLERQIPLFLNKPEIGVVYSARQVMDPVGRAMSVPQRPLYRGNVLNEIFRRNCVCFSSAVVRREVFERAGGFNEALPMAIDYELWLRIAKHYQFDFVNDPLVLYRTGHANISSAPGKRLEIVRQIIESFLQDEENQVRIAPRVRSFTLAEYWHDVGIVFMVEGRRRQAFAAFINALKYYPGLKMAWRGILTCLCPTWIRENILRLVGREDWTQKVSWGKVGM